MAVMNDDVSRIRPCTCGAVSVRFSTLPSPVRDAPTRLIWLPGWSTLSLLCWRKLQSDSYTDSRDGHGRALTFVPTTTPEASCMRENSTDKDKGNSTVHTKTTRLVVPNQRLSLGP